MSHESTYRRCVIQNSHVMYITTWELTQEGNHIPVTCVRRGLHNLATSVGAPEHIQVRNHSQSAQFTYCSMRTHTCEKPYSCNVGKRKFTQSPHLKAHTRTHTGEEPYSCTMCDMPFKLCYELSSYKRTHTGERPYTSDLVLRHSKPPGTLLST